MDVCKNCNNPKQGRCKICKREADKKYRSENKEKLKRYFQDLWQDPNRKAKNRTYKEKQRFGFDASEYVQDKCCEVCGITNAENITKTGRRLDVNHLDDNGRKALRLGESPNNQRSNFMVVCRSCHTAWHNRNIRDYEYRRTQSE